MQNTSNIFPPVNQADSDGFLCYSRELNPDLILEAYRNAIFPWPYDNKHVLWFSPPYRCIFEFEHLHIPKSTPREFRRAGFTLSVNQHFEKVIRHCATVPRQDGGTWIIPKLIKAYTETFHRGYAMSFETLDADGNLVGGMYGIRIGRFFAGESMFRLCDGASKFALLKGIEYLAANHGSTWLDAQVVNPFLTQLGAQEITRAQYLRKLRGTLAD
jgi:leucyl/phenylalanyl-tRNA--protein transferase